MKLYMINNEQRWKFQKKNFLFYCVISCISLYSFVMYCVFNCILMYYIVYSSVCYAHFTQNLNFQIAWSLIMTEQGKIQKIMSQVVTYNIMVVLKINTYSFSSATKDSFSWISSRNFAICFCCDSRWTSISFSRASWKKVGNLRRKYSF